MKNFYKRKSIILCFLLMIFILNSNNVNNFSEFRIQEKEITFEDNANQDQIRKKIKKELLEEVPPAWVISDVYYNREYISPFVNTADQIVHGDLDENTYPEIVIVGGDGANYGNITIIEYNPSSQEYEVLYNEVLGYDVAIYDAAIGDADNDGKLEIVYVYTGTHNNFVVLGYDSGTEEYVLEANVTNIDLGYGDVEVGDVDNDAKNEILITGGTFQVYRYNSTEDYELLDYELSAFVGPFNNLFNGVILDYDDDGKNEIGTVGENISFYDLKDNDTESIDLELELNDGNEAFKGEKIAKGNVDSDPENEICVLSPTYKTYIFDYDDGTNSLNLLYNLTTEDFGPGGYIDEFGKITIGDIDNDGTDEIVGDGIVIDHHGDDFRWKSFWSVDVPSVIADFDKDGYNEYWGKYDYSEQVEINPNEYWTYNYMCMLNITVDLYTYLDVTPPTIYHVTTQSSDHSVTISWETDDDTTGYADWVIIRQPPNATIITSENATHGTTHTVTINGLEADTGYQYELYSEGFAGRWMRGVYGDFVTMPEGETNNPPTVTLTNPTTGEISGEYDFTWDATDTDGDQLFFNIECAYMRERSDGSKEWSQLYVVRGITGTSFTFDTRCLPNADNYNFTIYAFDGHDWAYDENTDPITINNAPMENHPLWVSIEEPKTGSWVQQNAYVSYNLLDADGDANSITAEIKRIDESIWQPISLMEELEPNDGSFTFDSFMYQNGPYQIKITISDGIWEHSATTGVFNLANEGNNRLPSFEWIDPVAGTEVAPGDILNISLTVSDPDLDALDVSVYYQVDVGTEQRITGEYEKDGSVTIDTQFEIPSDVSGTELTIIVKAKDYFQTSEDSILLTLVDASGNGETTKIPGLTMFITMTSSIVSALIWNRRKKS